MMTYLKKSFQAGDGMTTHKPLIKVGVMEVCHLVKTCYV